MCVRITLDTIKVQCFNTVVLFSSSEGHMTFSVSTQPFKDPGSFHFVTHPSSRIWVSCIQLVDGERENGEDLGGGGLWARPKCGVWYFCSHSISRNSATWPHRSRKKAGNVVYLCALEEQVVGLATSSPVSATRVNEWIYEWMKWSFTYLPVQDPL